MTKITYKKGDQFINSKTGRIVKLTSEGSELVDSVKGRVDLIMYEAEFSDYKELFGLTDGYITEYTIKKHYLPLNESTKILYSKNYNE